MAGNYTVTVFPDEAVREARRLSTEDRVQIAEQIADDARATAPVLTGAFQSGIDVEVNGDQVQVVNNDPTAGFKEYGTGDTPAHATMTNAARRYGKYSGIKPRGSR
jgi:hypothetical protein